MCNPRLKQELETARDRIIGPGGVLQAIDEAMFHEAELKEKVKALTAHVNRSEIEFERMLNRMDDDQIKTLTRTLQKELVSVIKAVEEA